MATMAFVTRPWQVLGLRAVLGLFTGYGGLMLTMAADSAPPGGMASAIGRVQTAQRLGPALGPAIGGLLAGWLGLRPAFIAAAGLYVIALAIVMVLYEEGETTAIGGQAGTIGRVGYRAILSYEHFGLLMGVVFATQFVDRSVGPILALFVEELGVSSGRVAVVAGMLFSLMAVSAAVGHHVCARLLRRYPVRAAGALLLATAVTPWMVAPGAALFGAGSGTAMTAIYTTAGGIIPQGSQGTGFGLLTSASLLGVAISPVVAGFLGATSLRGVFVLDLIVLAGLVVVVRRRMADGRATR
jgi:MFS family permease